MHPIITKIFEYAGNIGAFSRELVERYGYNLDEIKEDNGICLFPSNKEECINAIKNTNIKTEIVRIANCFFVLESAINCAAKIVNGNEDYYEALKISNTFKDEEFFGRIAMIRFQGSNSLGKMLQSGRYATFDSEEIRQIASSIDITLFILMSLLEISKKDVKPFIDSLLNEYNNAYAMRPKVSEENYFYNDLKAISDNRIDSKEFFAILGRVELAIRHFGAVFSRE